MSLRITFPAPNVAAAKPLLLTIIVQVNEFPRRILLLTLLAFVTTRSGRERYTVTRSVFDVTPLIVAVAVFVTEAAAKSAGVTV